MRELGRNRRRRERRALVPQDPKSERASDTPTGARPGRPLGGIGRPRGTTSGVSGPVRGTRDRRTAASHATGSPLCGLRDAWRHVAQAPLAGAKPYASGVVGCRYDIIYVICYRSGVGRDCGLARAHVCVCVQLSPARWISDLRPPGCTPASSRKSPREGCDATDEDLLDAVPAHDVPRAACRSAQLLASMWGRRPGGNCARMR